jgi:hypothetical protein
MQKNMPKLGIALMAAVMAVCMGGWGTLAFAKALVEVTGQTTSQSSSRHPGSSSLLVNTR